MTEQQRPTFDEILIQRAVGEGMPEPVPEIVKEESTGTHIIFAETQPSEKPISTGERRIDDDYNSESPDLHRAYYEGFKLYPSSR